MAAHWAGEGGEAGCDMEWGQILGCAQNDKSEARRFRGERFALNKFGEGCLDRSTMGFEVGR